MTCFGIVVGALGVTVSRVVITALKGSTFYAYLELRQGAETYPRGRAAQRRRCPGDPHARAHLVHTIGPRAGAVRSKSSTDEADQDRLQRWLESLDPDEMGYKM